MFETSVVAVRFAGGMFNFDWIDISLINRPNGDMLFAMDRPSSHLWPPFQG
jgi:hypothetical protein